LTEKEAIQTLKDPMSGNLDDAFEKSIKELRATEAAIKALEKQIKIKEILQYRDNAFVGQEFGASYCDLNNVIEQIREVIECNEEEYTNV